MIYQSPRLTQAADERIRRMPLIVDEARSRLSVAGLGLILVGALLFWVG